MGGWQQPFARILLLGIAEGVVAIAFLLFIEGDPENTIFLGLSWRRWLLVAVAALFTLGNIWLLRRWVADKRVAAAVKAMSRSLRLFAVSAAVTLVGLLSLALWALSTDTMLVGILSRILPLAGLATLLGLQVMAWQYSQHGGNLWRGSLSRAGASLTTWSKRAQGELTTLFQRIAQPRSTLILVIAVSTLPVLGNALRYELPLGFAGLYALMAEELAANHFSLPETIPFYGPGGIPFTHPPAAFYVMGLFTEILGVPVWSYLRFAGPIFSLLALLPLYAFVLELTQSRVVAATATLLVAFSVPAYILQATSGGVVRGLAFLFMMSGLFVLVRGLRAGRAADISLAALCFGLTLLTHWLYAQFFVVFTAYYVLLHPNRKGPTRAALVGLGGLILAAPWLLVTIAQHGSDWILASFDAHGNSYFLTLAQNPRQLIPWISANFQHIWRDPMVTGLFLLGLVALLSRGRLRWPIFILLVLVVMSEAERVLIIWVGIVIGLVLDEFLQHIKSQARTKRLAWVQVGVFLGLALLLLCAWGFVEIRAQRPTLTPDTFALAEVVQELTPSEDTYLVLAGATEAEWFPYLLRRTPVAASWGSEWTGQYSTQLGYVLMVEECAGRPSAQCLAAAIAEFPHQPDYLITHSDAGELTNELAEDSQWKMRYENQTYVLWSR